MNDIFLPKITNFRILDRGLSRPIVGEFEGKKYLFKRGNPQVALREIMGNRLMNILGVKVPYIDYGKYMYEDNVEFFLRLEFIEDSLALDEFFFEICKGCEKRLLKELSLIEFIRIQLVDTIIANVDRSSTNLLIKNGEFYAIDHSKSFYEELGFTNKIDSAQLLRVMVNNPLSNHIFKNLQNYIEWYYILINEIQRRFNLSLYKSVTTEINALVDEKIQANMQSTILLRIRRLKKQFNEFEKTIEKNKDAFLGLIFELERVERVDNDTIKRYLEGI